METIESEKKNQIEFGGADEKLFPTVKTFKIQILFTQRIFHLPCYFKISYFLFTKIKKNVSSS